MDFGAQACNLAGPGQRSVDEAAVIAVRLATLRPVGPTGGFFHDGHANESQHPW
jgi:hypothetical protein